MFFRSDLQQSNQHSRSEESFGGSKTITTPTSLGQRKIK